MTSSMVKIVSSPQTVGEGSKITKEAMEACEVQSQPYARVAGNPKIVTISEMVVDAGAA